MIKFIPVHMFHPLMSQLTPVQCFGGRFPFIVARQLPSKLRVTLVDLVACDVNIFARPQSGEKDIHDMTVFSLMYSQNCQECVGFKLLAFSCFFLLSMEVLTLVQWFSVIGDEPEDETGLWMVEPDVYEDGLPFLAVIHLDSIFRAAHLMPAYLTSDFVRRSLTMHDTLDEFKKFYVNKFVDHHAFEIAL